MTDTNSEQSSVHCKNCKKVFDVSDAEEFEKFCSAECGAEYKAELTEFRREEIDDEIRSFEAKEKERAIEDGEVFE